MATHALLETIPAPRIAKLTRADPSAAPAAGVRFVGLGDAGRIGLAKRFLSGISIREELCITWRRTTRGRLCLHWTLRLNGGAGTAPLARRDVNERRHTLGGRRRERRIHRVRVNPEHAQTLPNGDCFRLRITSLMIGVGVHPIHSPVSKETHDVSLTDHMEGKATSTRGADLNGAVPADGRQAVVSRIHDPALVHHEVLQGWKWEIPHWGKTGAFCDSAGYHAQQSKGEQARIRLAWDVRDRSAISSYAELLAARDAVQAKMACSAAIAGKHQAVQDPAALDNWLQRRAIANAVPTGNWATATAGAWGTGIAWGSWGHDPQWDGVTLVSKSRQKKKRRTLRKRQMREEHQRHEAAHQRREALRQARELERDAGWFAFCH
ncbi:hypothetical protein B0H11DRAFT_1925841 [Mycena galericulata]|nr:hypothetical protein B0H11DRAFT_1925841 [Mycena galericulata]